jgi:hypothetical protein
LEKNVSPPLAAIINHNTPWPVTLAVEAAPDAMSIMETLHVPGTA